MHVILLSSEYLFQMIKLNLEAINPLNIITQTSNIDELLFLARKGQYDCVILDANLEDVQGIMRIRNSKHRIPIICISETPLKNKVPILEAGADYYIENFKIDHMVELSLVVSSMGRRVRGFASNLVAIENVTIDLDEGRLYKDGEDAKLRPKELKIIEYLLFRNGKIIAYQDIEELFDTGKDNISVHICSLKTKIRLPKNHPANIRAYCGRGVLFPKVKECKS